MKRIAIALLVVAACSGKDKKADTAGTGSGGLAVYAKKISLDWGITQQTGKADVYFQTTDETGKMVSHPLGTYDGTCQKFVPTPEMKAVTGLNCTDANGSTVLHAVIQRGGASDHVIILKAKVAAGGSLDPMAREQLTQIEVPPGAAIETTQTPQ